MAAKVITVARTTGAGAEDAARLAAERLGFRYIDDEIIQEAALRAGTSPQAVEQTEHKRPLLERLIAVLGASGMPEAGVAPDASLAAFVSSGPYQEFIVDVIRETAAQGDVVMVAHGSGMCLAGQPGTLRVLVTASPGVRAERLAAGGAMDRRAAENEVRRSDGERADFLQRFYRVSRERETDYDLVCNTDRLSVQEVARIIVEAARG
jgi:cytidylate kinase